VGQPSSSYGERSTYGQPDCGEVIIKFNVLAGVELQSDDTRVARPAPQRSTVESQVNWIAPEVPTDFCEQYLELFDLRHGWDGGDEDPPSSEVLTRTLRIALDIAVYVKNQGHELSFPELAPGFKGEVGLEYVKSNKGLCIEISPGPDGVAIMIMKVLKNERGKVIEISPVLEDDLTKSVDWLVED